MNNKQNSTIYASAVTNLIAGTKQSYPHYESISNDQRYQTLVEKERNFTVSAFGIKRGSLSSHFSGTVAFRFVYTRISNVPNSYYLKMGTLLFMEREESDRSSNLANDRLDFLLDLIDILFSGDCTLRLYNFRIRFNPESPSFKHTLTIYSIDDKNKIV